MKLLVALLLLTLSIFANIPQNSPSSDPLDSTRVLVDSRGALTDSYAYTPYGKFSSHEGTSENSFLFTGEQYDPEVGLYYLRARYYSPELARFLSRDTFEGTLSDPLSQNAYLYARGNPAVYVDPSGHFFTMADLNMMMNTISYLSIRYSLASIPRTGFVGAVFNLARAVSIRIQYMKRVKKLAQLAEELYAEGKSAEEIARIVHRKRRALGRLFKDITDPKTRERIFSRNIEKYGDKWGPTIEYLRNSGKSWEDIIESATRPNTSLVELMKIFFGL